MPSDSYTAYETYDPPETPQQILPETEVFDEDPPVLPDPETLDPAPE